MSAFRVQFNLNCLHLCSFQNMPEHERPGELTKELRMADDNLLPKFLEALTENGQQHVVRILVPEGLHMSAISIFTALHGMQTRSSDEHSVRPSVRLSVCLSHA